MVGWVDGRVSGWIDGCINGWMEGWMIFSFQEFRPIQENFYMPVKLGIKGVKILSSSAKK